LDNLFIYISNVFPFPGLPFRFPSGLLPYPSPDSMRVLPPPLRFSCPGIPLHWGIEHPQAQGPLLPLMSNKALLFHISDQHHGLLHVYSLVGGSVPRNSGVSVMLILLLPPWGFKPPLLLQPFSKSSIGAH
ncbi:mCG144580, partial [Mus musculus]